MTPINMPGPDASDKDWRVFLEHQLANAVHLLRTKDATEEQCIARLNLKYQALFDHQEKSKDRWQKECLRLEQTYGASHARYLLLRQHQVQVWKLGIAATGEQLDKALDEQIERAQKKAA